MAHIDTEAMLDALEGRLSVEDAKGLREHLATCRHCSDEFGQFSAMLDALTLPALESAPHAALQKAFDIFRPPGNQHASISEVVASLVFDSWSRPAIAGLRGHADTRQLSLAAGEFDLHLSIDDVGDGMTIRGQLLGRDDGRFPGDFDAILYDAAQNAVVATIANEMGEFSFENAPDVAVTLAIRLSDRRTLWCQLPESAQK